MRGYGEEAFFAGDLPREQHWDTVCRQWHNAIKELRAELERGADAEKAN